MLAPWLNSREWPEDLARLAADAVGCHHGSRASAKALEDLEGDRSALGSREWADARHQLLDALFAVFTPTSIPTKSSLSGPEFMLLAGLTSFADWIGSNADWFGFSGEEAVAGLDSWFKGRCSDAERALDAIGWLPRTALSASPRDFADVFGFAPRPLQQAVADMLEKLTEPAILLVEAPMGEGKTEAAWFAHLELQRRFEHRGMYIALPTQATGNAMFERTLGFLRRQGVERMLDVQLLHGGSFLNDSFQQLRLTQIYDEDNGR